MFSANGRLGRTRVIGLAAALFLSGCSEAKAPVPKAPSRLVEKSFFGMHVHWHDISRPLRLPPVGAIRLWDTRTNWANLKPSPGAPFAFDRLDRFVSMGEQLGADVMLTFGVTPRWAARLPDIPGAYGPGSSSPPRVMSDWDDYVRAVASRYRGRIKFYEVINEPSLMVPTENCEVRRSFFCTTASDLVSLVDHSRAMILAADPAAKVTSPGFVHAWRLRDYLAAGGGVGARALDVHIYPPDSTAAQAKAFKEARSVLAANRKARMPFWNSEAGFPLLDNGFEPGERRISEADGPGAVTRFLVLSAASRFERVYYYAWDNLRYGLSTDGGTEPTSAGRAYLTTMSWLLGKRIFPCDEVADLWTCQLLDGTNRATIVWSDRAGGDTFEVTEGTTYLHALNGRITLLNGPTRLRVGREPVLLSYDAARWSRPLSLKIVGN